MKSKNIAAFTLVELLVVIAIIALLITLVTPAISNALGRARTTVTITQLRQIGGGMFEFLGDHNWIYPVRFADSVAFGFGGGANGDRQRHWQEQMNRYLTDSHNENSIYNHRQNPIWYSPNASPLGHHFGLNHNMPRSQWDYRYRVIPNPGQIVIVGEVNVDSSLFRPDLPPVFSKNTITTYRISNPGDIALYLFGDMRVQQLKGDQGENVNPEMYRWW